MYNTNGDKSVVACRNNLETAYLLIIETAKTTDVYIYFRSSVVKILRC